MAVAELSGLAIEASDVSGEKLVSVDGISPDASIGEVVHSLVAEMDLPRLDVEGRPMTYQALLEREGRHLHASEIVGDVLEPQDRLVLQPYISAGGGN
jgi:hypothetical protein